MENESMDCTEENEVPNTSVEKQDSQQMCLNEPPNCIENVGSKAFDESLEQAVTSMEPTNNVESNISILPPLSAISNNPLQEDSTELMNITEDVTPKLPEPMCENNEETLTVVSDNQNTSQLPEFIGPVIPNNISLKESTNCPVIHVDPKADFDITPKTTNDTLQNFKQSNKESFIQRSNFAKKEAPHFFSHSTIIELSTSSWSPTKTDIQPYLRGCKWSPDGSSCLCVVNNDGVHVINLPSFTEPICTDRAIDILRTDIHIKEAGLVYDFCWYPSKKDSPPQW